jgi:sugar lactone lactonase YvrE
MGVTVDSSGKLYIADTGNNRIRQVTLDGLINTVAGGGSSGFSGDGGLATAAMIRMPSGIAVDSSGNLYIADMINNRIRKVTPDGMISTVAGNGTRGFSGDGGQATMAMLNWPNKLAVDSSGNIYFADGDNERIRKITPDGKITTVVGSGNMGFSGDGGPATAAQYIWVGGMTIDSSGNLYFSDYQNHRIRKVDTNGVINTVAGSGTTPGPNGGGYSGDGGPATAAKLKHPTGVAVDSAGNIYFGDSDNSVVRKVTGGIIKTIAGNGHPGYSGDGGPAIQARLNGGMIANPSIGVAVDSANNLYIADTSDNVIRKVTPDGVINTIVGNANNLIMNLGAFNNASPGGFSGDGGIATAAQLSFTPEVAVDSAGNLFVSDGVNGRIRKVTSILDCSSLAVNAGGVAACRTPGTNATGRAGYAKLTLNSGTAPYGTAVFSLKQNGVTVTEAGVPASPPTTQARIFIDYRASVTAIPGRIDSGTIDINTGMGIVNNGSAAATVIYTLRDLNGVNLAVGHGTIAAGSHVACFINQLKETAASDFILPSNFQSAIQFGTLDITSDQSLSIMALRGVNSQRKEFLLTTTPVADLTKPQISSPIYFPQFADGGGYTTSLVLMNTSDQIETGTLEILDNVGAPLVVNQVGGTAASSFAYSIPAGGAFRFQADGASYNAKAGWVRLTHGSLQWTPVGSGVFSYNPGSTLVSESGVPSATATMHARLYVDLSANHNTGLAIANIDSIAANITINAYQPDGVSAVGSSFGPLQLSANGHDSKFANQLIEGLPDGYRGVLDITSTTPFAALTVRSFYNERNEFLMTTFPIADANQAAPSPIIFPQVADGGGYVTEFILISAGAAANTKPSFYSDAGVPTDFSH